ncbi:putative succinate dehydrogenase (quinone) [Rosa chinensis]|uniref:Putative succinate dehydrogenase (Quinone) n=1 Tax=Rosa chinensis TaxID=74649 RepID=A0A2P6QM45_ROSCH|nr:putative succinate dehydrogenase (quinone) [Rosa chinensis]
MVTTSDSTLSSGAMIQNYVANDVASELDKMISQPQQHFQHQYYQHSGFGSQPFNHFVGPFTAPCSSGFQSAFHLAPTTHYSDTDPFTMSYSGPYQHTPLSFPPQPQLSLPFAVPTYLNMQNPTHTTPPFSTVANQTSLAHQHYTVPHRPPPQFGFQQQPLQNFQPPQDVFPLQHMHQPQHPFNHIQTLPTMKQMKLDFPTFSGGDPIEWLNKAEQFFDFYQIPEDRKLAIAAMHLADKASDRWFMFRHEFPPTWLGLADLLMREFSGHNLSDYQAALARMSQTGSVEQYMEQFTKLSRRAPGFSQQVLLSCFLGGLKDGIRANVKAQKPRSLYDAYEFARIYEEKENSHRSHMRVQLGVRTTSALPPRVAQTNQLGAANNVPRVHNPPARAPPLNNVAGGGQNGGNRRLSQAEYQERRARNQCFFCDEIFRPGHNCRRGQLMLLSYRILQQKHWR